jgi:hypothetical protein
VHTLTQQHFAASTLLADVIEKPPIKSTMNASNNTNALTTLNFVISVTSFRDI